MASDKRHSARRKTDPVPQPEELTVKVPGFSFDLKGAGVRKWGARIIFGIFALAAIAAFGWFLLKFPAEMLEKQKQVLGKGTSIEKKVEEVKQTEAKHHRTIQKELVKLGDALEDQAIILGKLQERLELTESKAPIGEAVNLSRGD